jgi:hypothetical protein
LPLFCQLWYQLSLDFPTNNQRSPKSSFQKPDNNGDSWRNLKKAAVHEKAIKALFAVIQSHISCQLWKQECGDEKSKWEAVRGQVGIKSQLH